VSEERLAALEARIAELEDKVAITALIHRYALCIRMRDKAACQALLCDDAWFELRHVDPEDPAADSLVTRLEGSAAMVGGYDSEAGAANSVWPMIHNIDVVVDGNRARALCVMASAIWPVGQQFVGEYHDELVRTEAGWRFASRTYRLIGEVGGKFASEARKVYQAAKG
jgi:hypothetical protein